MKYVDADFKTSNSILTDNIDDYECKVLVFI